MWSVPGYLAPQYLGARSIQDDMSTVCHNLAFLALNDTLGDVCSVVPLAKHETRGSELHVQLVLAISSNIDHADQDGSTHSRRNDIPDGTRLKSGDNEASVDGIGGGETGYLVDYLKPTPQATQIADQLEATLQQNSDFGLDNMLKFMFSRYVC